VECVLERPHNTTTFNCIGHLQVSALMAVDQHGCTALHYCATNRRTLVIDLLLERWLQTGSEARRLLEIRDCEGLTVLAHAVIAGNQTIVEHLLVLGADVSCHDNERHTIMHFATGQISSAFVTHATHRRGGTVFTSVCLCVCLFFRMISQKPMQLG